MDLREEVVNSLLTEWQETKGKKLANYSFKVPMGIIRPLPETQKSLETIQKFKKNQQWNSL